MNVGVDLSKLFDLDERSCDVLELLVGRESEFAPDAATVVMNLDRFARKSAEWRGSYWAREMLQKFDPSAVSDYLEEYGFTEAAGSILSSFDRGARETVWRAMDLSSKEAA